MFNDVSKQNFNYDNDREFNRNVLKKNNINIGAEVRILESKGKLEKGSQKYSTDLYKLVEREGNRFLVQDSEGEKLRRKLKPWPSLNPRCSREPHDRVPSGDTRCTYYFWLYFTLSTKEQVLNLTLPGSTRFPKVAFTATRMSAPWRRKNGSSVRQTPLFFYPKVERGKWFHANSLF